MSAKNTTQNPDRLLQALNAVTIVIFVAMVILTLSQVLFRFVLRIPVPWPEELARICYVYIIFLGAAMAEAADDQIKATFFLHRIPIKTRFYVQCVINVFCIIVQIFIFISSIIIFRVSLVGGFHFGTMPFLPFAILYIPLIIGAPVTIWYLIRQLIYYTGGKGSKEAQELTEKLNKQDPDLLKGETQ